MDLQENGLIILKEIKQCREGRGVCDIVAIQIGDIPIVASIAH